MLQCGVMMLTRLAALLRSLSLSLQLHQVCIKQQAPAEHARSNLDGAWPCWAGRGCHHRSRGATPFVMPLHNHKLCQNKQCCPVHQLTNLVSLI